MPDEINRIKKQNPQMASPAGAAVAARPLIPEFPPEFQRNISDYFDKRYYAILSASAMIVGVSLLWVSTLDLYDNTSEEAREALKKQFVQLVLQQEIEEPEVVEEVGEAQDAGDEGDAEKEEKEEAPERTEETTKQTQAQKQEERQARRSERRSRRKAMQEEVAGQGVLGVLTARGGGGTGIAEVDVLSDVGGGGGGDLDETLAGAGGVRTAKGRGDRTRTGRGGGRGTGGAGVGDLIDDVGTAGSSELGGRKGGFSLARLTLKGRASKSAARNSDALQRVINSQMSAFQFCYQQEVRKNPNLRGEVKVRFTITYAGKVTRAKVVSSTLNNAKVERCVVQKISRLRFDAIGKREGNSTIEQTFSFGG